MPHALIVDDDGSTLMLLSRLLGDRGFTTRTARTLAEARASQEPKPDCCIVDLKLPDGDGTDLLEEGLGESVYLIVVTGDGSVASSVDALRRGARDYLTKPVTRAKVDRALARFAGCARAPRKAIIGESAEMRHLEQAIARVAPTDVAVLIVGESGTGKELIAHRLHLLSNRARGPYLALHCGAVSPNLLEGELFGQENGSFAGVTRRHSGYFERSDGGTLFLDEVTEMPLEFQVRVLRVLETGRVARVGSPETIPVNVRVIAATNRDPREAVRQGRLREDLLYRLQVVPLEVPPLRRRTGDVRLLALHLLADLNAATGAQKTFGEAALAWLEQYHWPGNVRELYHRVQRAYILARGRVITQPNVAHDPPADSTPDANETIRVCVGDALADVEQRLILHTLRNCRTQEEAARLLGVSTRTLYNKLRLYEAAGRARPLDANDLDDHRESRFSVRPGATSRRARDAAEH